MISTRLAYNNNEEKIMLKRKDATLIKSVDPFHSIVPYVMPKRTEAEVSITENFDVTEILKYIKKFNKANPNKELKLFHCICYALGRTIYHRPKMNIFLAGRKFWQRNDISLSFVAKQKFDDHADEVLMFLKVKPEMNINDFSSIIRGDVKKARKASGNDLDKLMKFVGNLPRPILELFFWIISRLEYHGLMPESLSNGDPNYSTCLISNLGSIGAGSVYHHLSNYGTCSAIVTIGTITRDNKTKKDYVPMTFTIDERIADGFYFAKSLRITHHILENPKKLNERISDDLKFDADAKFSSSKKKTVKGKK